MFSPGENYPMWQMRKIAKRSRIIIPEIQWNFPDYESRRKWCRKLQVRLTMQYWSPGRPHTRYKQGMFRLQITLKGQKFRCRAHLHSWGPYCSGERGHAGLLNFNLNRKPTGQSVPYCKLKSRTGPSPPRFLAWLLLWPQVLWWNGGIWDPRSCHVTQ